MQHLIKRIVLVGPMGIGKTTAIRSLCGSLAIECEVPNLDKQAHAKETTTVGLDFGEIKLDDNDTLQVYGCPGQERYDFVREWALSLAFGAIVMVDIHEPNALEHTATLIQQCFRSPKLQVVVVLISRPASAAQQEMFTVRLSNYPQCAVPVLSADPRNPAQMLDTLDIIAAMLPDETPA
ncbi:GTP-binding protein [Comamonas odontotermitis]|uniref:GTP-binding protein n=1 Tax=Comamonas TaxID=283 RepID=UPI00320BB67F